MNERQLAELERRAALLQNQVREIERLATSLCSEAKHLGERLEYHLAQAKPASQEQTEPTKSLFEQGQSSG